MLTKKHEGQEGIKIDALRGKGIKDCKETFMEYATYICQPFIELGEYGEFLATEPGKLDRQKLIRIYKGPDFFDNTNNTPCYPHKHGELGPIGPSETVLDSQTEQATAETFLLNLLEFGSA